MKAVILAGGTGSRLYPLTQVASKQLQPVYDKPMIYYPLTLVIAAGIGELCLITTSDDQARFRRLLGDGSQWGIRIEYRTQDRPEGIGQAVLIAESFIAGDDFVLILGDNIFFGGDAFPEAISNFSGGAVVFAYHVQDPQNYGVVTFSSTGSVLSIDEKPQLPDSNFAVPGIYIYDGKVADIARDLRPSARGELEITDINRAYLARGQLMVHRLSRGAVWLDAGTSESLYEAASYVEMIERRQGLKLGCPEEAALVRGFLSVAGLRECIAAIPSCSYRDYLIKLANDGHEQGAHD